MRNFNEGRLSAGALGAALVVVTVWGFNFTVVKLGLADVPPCSSCPCASPSAPSRRSSS